MPLNTMLWRSPSGTSSAIGAVSLVTGRLSPVSAASAVWSAADSIRRAVRWDRVAFFDQNDVARHDAPTAGMLRRSPPRMTVGVGGGHRPKRGHRGLRARLLDVAHRRVQQDDREDRDGLVRQRRITLVRPEARRNRRGDQQQDDEHILELREKSPPCRDGLLGGELISSIALEPRLGFFVGQSLPIVGAERVAEVFDALAVRHTRIRRFAHCGRQDVTWVAQGAIAAIV